jgi:hypothetical protein
MAIIGSARARLLPAQSQSQNDRSMSRITIEHRSIPMHRIQPTTAAALLVLVVLSACSPAPHVPSDWPSRIITQQEVEGEDQTPLLQVFLCYGLIVDNHTTLRLVNPGKPALFWDPGGSFREQYPESPYSAYLFYEQAPSALRYLQWRMRVPDAATEIFEFQLSPSEAEQMWAVLRHGTSADDPRGAFSSSSIPMRCCLSISDYLQRFAPARLQPGRKFFWPRDLAKVFYTMTPKRVMIYRRHRDMLEIQPQRAAAGR